MVRPLVSKTGLDMPSPIHTVPCYRALWHGIPVSAHMLPAHMVSAPPGIGTPHRHRGNRACRSSRSRDTPRAGGELLHAKRQRHVVGGNGRHQLQDVAVLGILLDAPMIHLLQGLMILLAEGHRALWRFEGEPLHGSN